MHLLEAAQWVHGCGMSEESDLELRVGSPVLSATSHVMTEAFHHPLRTFCGSEPPGSAATPSIIQH